MEDPQEPQEAGTIAPLAGTPAQEQAASLAAPSPDEPGPAGAPAAEASGPPAGGRVRLAPQWPVESVTLPPLEDGADGIVIPAEGAELSREDADRAHEAARRAGYQLAET